jgi:hypothetical protein
MSIQARTLGLFLAAIAALLVPTGARGGLITQSASIPLTSTDFGPGSAGVQPLVFQKFDTHSDALALDSVTLSYTAQIQNTFGMTFTTPATITDSVATGNAATPGPTITLYQPDGTHALLTVKAPNDPAFRDGPDAAPDIQFEPADDLAVLPRAGGLEAVEFIEPDRARRSCRLHRDGCALAAGRGEGVLSVHHELGQRLGQRDHARLGRRDDHVQLS